MVFVALILYSFCLVLLWDPFLALSRRQRRGAALVDGWLLLTRFGRAGDSFGPREMPMLLRGRWAVWGRGAGRLRAERVVPWSLESGAGPLAGLVDSFGRVAPCRREQPGFASAPSYW